ncbi:HU family DNA-binding protein [Thioalkalivibrio sp. HK1]|uniref:HU family DNA-binding protein n=1 Tax=Thioalkalivibrio sp. HK1 TaxID=1469245 RepID=UPI00047143B5|nr:HU family DNA-binding protein [Thioalkalivibrio sp. HK1]
MAKTPALKVPLTKTQLVSEIATNTELTKQQVAGVIDELGNQIKRHVEKKGPGTFTMPGLLKIKTVRKPATKARKGVNPFNGEPMEFKAKPAHTTVKIQPLKGLKEMAEPPKS